MTRLRNTKLISILSLLAFFSFASQADTEQELQQFWQDAAKTVISGDFDGYAATFAQDAILVSDIAKTSYPISQALSRWQKGFNETKAGKIKAGVSFKFTSSLISDKTAHQSGYFYYFSDNGKGELSPFIAQFEALLIKKADKWQVIMERHIKQVDLATWQSI